MILLGLGTEKRGERRELAAKMSSSLEDDSLGNLEAHIEWPANSRLSPEFTMLLPHALRPHEMRAAGLPNPAPL